VVLAFDRAELRSWLMPVTIAHSVRMSRSASSVAPGQTISSRPAVGLIIPRTTATHQSLGLACAAPRAP
jgi:hypothetical protein